MRLINMIILLTCISFTSSAQYQIPTSYDDILAFSESWAKCHFNDCYPNRKFQKIWRLTTYEEMHDDDGDYEFVQGKIYYTNYIDLPQTNMFQMKIYSDKVVFYKQSLSVVSGKWEWEICSKRRGNCR